MCHAAGYPSGVPHLADSGWLTSSCSGGLAWGWGCLGTDVLFTTLVFYLVPAQLPLPLLPLRGSAPLTGASACLTPGGWAGGIFAAPLGFLPCAVLFLRACSVRCFPLGVFRSPGVCPFASLVTWVGLQPFPSFSMLLLLRLLAG